MNTLLKGLKENTNFTYTENGMKVHESTNSALLDMFAFGGAYRKRTNDDCITLFKSALEDSFTYGLKCLFYLRDVRGGQGERRFFRVCMNWLADTYPEAAGRVMKHIPEYGRWDDLYCLMNTCLETEALELIKEQLLKDVYSETPSLLAKWLPSENASSKHTKYLAIKTRNHLGFTSKQYRVTLSTLRKRINVLERLMSSNDWDKIDFSGIPSKAGLNYKDAFIRRPETAERYSKFLEDKTSKVNAAVLNPVDIVHKVFKNGYNYYVAEELSKEERAALQKYWDNLKDYYNGRKERGIAVVDVSGSMYGLPLEAAIAMGAYIAERGEGPFKNHFITFSRDPKLVKFEGVDIYDKVKRCIRADWGYNTNIQKTMNLILNTAIANNCSQDEMPETLYIFSDMQFDRAFSSVQDDDIDTFFEHEKEVFESYGYKMPRVIFWNLDARENTIPAIGEGFSYISGFSMIMLEQILSGLDGMNILINKLGSERYANIY